MNGNGDTNDLHADRLESVILELDEDGMIQFISEIARDLFSVDVQSMLNENIGNYTTFNRVPLSASLNTDISETSLLSFKSANSALKTMKGSITIFFDFNGNAAEAQGLFVLQSFIWIVSNHHTGLSMSKNLCIPSSLYRTTGFSIDLFNSYLQDMNTFTAPPPPQELCRICERFIRTWWFIRHHWFCSVEHKIEGRISMLREQLVESKMRIQNRRYAAKISSPLAKSSLMPHPQNPFQLLLYRSDLALSVDTYEIRASVEVENGDYNANALQLLNKIHDLDSALDSDIQPAWKQLNALIDELVLYTTRFIKFLLYRKLLAVEIETQVYVAIDHTIKQNEEVIMSDDECKDITPKLQVTNSGYASPLMSQIPQPPLSPSHQHSQSSLKRTTSNRSIRSQRSMRSMRSASSCFDNDILPLPSIADYQLVRLLNRGSYGKVYLARKRLTGDLFAVKVLKKRTMVQRNQVLNVKHERRVLMTTASSPYVATLHYSFQSQDFLYLVLEFVEGGDVSSLLRKVGCLNEEWALRYFCEIVVAVDSVHEHNILHRDLKPENLLIDKFGHLKLSDFGLSMQIGEPGKFENRVRGTPDYLAPETLKNQFLDRKADWWSVGCILFEFLYGYPPFNDSTPALIFSHILNCEIAWPDLPPELDISADIKNLITGLLNLNRGLRLGSKDIKAHNLFRQVDWSTLFQQTALYIPPPINDSLTPTKELADEPVIEPDADLVFSRSFDSPTRSQRLSSSSIDDDSSSEFGHFSYRNLPVLEKANTEVIHKINSITPDLSPSPSSPRSPTR